MFEPLPPSVPKQPSSEVRTPSLSTAKLPVDLEQEFAEMQATAPSPNPAAGLLAAMVLFHVLLIVEQRTFGSSLVSLYLLRGVPVTVCTAALLFARPAFRQRSLGCVALAALAICLIVGPVAGIPFPNIGDLFWVQGAVAVLLLLAATLFYLPLSWALTLAVAAPLADGLVLLLGPSVQTVGAAAAVQSCWAPVFAASLAAVLGVSHRNQARRDFLLVRQAAFAALPTAPEQAQGPHLDASTGVANRLAFDMRFRAAWEQAAGRRHSVALLFFSIDYLAEHKRELGSRNADVLQGQVGTCLKEGLRRSDDMVARFDNHHFVVMLPGVGADGATQIAERLRGCVEDVNIFAGRTGRRITVTVGAASLRAKRGVPREKLVEGAIQALDQAHAVGHNLVCVEGRGCVPAMS